MFANIFSARKKFRIFFQKCTWVLGWVSNKNHTHKKTRRICYEEKNLKNQKWTFCYDNVMKSLEVVEKHGRKMGKMPNYCEFSKAIKWTIAKFSLQNVS